VLVCHWKPRPGQVGRRRDLCPVRGHSLGVCGGYGWCGMGSRKGGQAGMGMGSRCPWTALLTGGFCGLRTAPQCDKMQRHLPHDDPEDPRVVAYPLSAQPRVLRQACHHVGTKASFAPSGPSAGPRSLLTPVHTHLPHPGLPAKGLRMCSLCS
jgi:hypothetical protein